MSSLRLPDFGSVLSEKSGCPCERSAADCAWEGPLILEVAQQASHKCPQSDAIPSTKAAQGGDERFAVVGGPGLAY